MTRPDTVVLDLDGTLVDSVYVHALAWKEAFREVGINCPTYQLHKAVGMGGDKLVAAVAGETTEDAMGEVLRKIHDDVFRVRRPEVHGLDGVPELLQACRDAGLEQVVASSSQPEDTDALLELVDGAWMIGKVVSGDAGPSKPSPDLVERALEQAGSREAFLVGDAVWDVEAAARAGIPCVGVLTGGYSEAELTEAGAVAVYDTPRELAAALPEVLTRLAG
jgi:phosphoglycolate phosphatase